MQVVSAVEIVAEYVVDVTFADGSRRRVDLEPFLWGEAFAGVKSDYEQFGQVRVDHELGTLVWPGDVDIDPDVLHGDELPAERLPTAPR